MVGALVGTHAGGSDGAEFSGTLGSGGVYVGGGAVARLKIWEIWIYALVILNPYMSDVMLDYFSFVLFCKSSSMSSSVYRRYSPGMIFGNEMEWGTNRP